MQGVNKNLLYTSSYFRTSDSSFFGTDEVMQNEAMYEVYPDFDVADGMTVRGVYDTTKEALVDIKADSLIQADMVSYC